jgi:hypothetical protein
VILSGLGLPMLVPFCERCDRPVARLLYDRAPRDGTWGFQARCCGVTFGARLSQQEILRVSTSGEKFYVIPKAKRDQRIRAQPAIVARPKERIFSRYSPPLLMARKASR